MPFSSKHGNGIHSVLRSGITNRVPSGSFVAYNSRMGQFSFSTFSGLFGYIDPASGSILLQVIIAGALGTFGYFFRPIWRFFRMLGGKKTESPKTPEHEGGPDKPPIA